METFLNFLLLNSFGTALSLLVYKILFKSDSNFKIRRYFLLACLLFSLVLPFHQYKIILPETISVLPVSPIAASTSNTNKTISNSQVSPEPVQALVEVSSTASPVNWIDILLMVYLFAVALIILIKTSQITFLIFLYRKSEKRHSTNYTLVFNSRFKDTFTFFRWIFINTENDLEQSAQQIIDHELAHIRQLHFIDLILLEALSIALWFNPFIWLMKKEFRLVHEFLADKAVLDKGKDKLAYQSLLVNQVAEGKLIGLSSSFNHSLIGKRIQMMNSKKVSSKSRIKLLGIAPIVITLFLIVSCTNSTNDSNIHAAIELQNMNILYTGIANPVKIALSDHDTKDLKVHVSKGIIEGENGNYTILVNDTGQVYLTVSYKGKILQHREFIARHLNFKASDPNDTNYGIEYQKIKPEHWMKGLGISEKEYLQLVYWVSDSLSYEKDKVPVGTNVLYTGMDNYIEVPATKGKTSVKVNINNGTIRRKGDYFIAVVKELGKAVITVHINEEEVQRKEFIVKEPELSE
jgi:beta-lactamase regulating signal transducer with metallopeptidase domain